MYNILIVDDEEDIREVISDTLSDEGYVTIKAHNVKSAMEVMSKYTLHLVILDIWLEGHHMDGIGLLRTIKKEQPNTPVIMISGHANTELAVQTIKLGAYDFIEKPFKAEKLLIVAKRAIEAKQLAHINELLVEDIKDLAIIGNSKIITSIRNQIPIISNSNSRVILQGDYGVGKSFIAKVIHYNSKRSSYPFIQYKTQNKSEEQILCELFDNHSQSKDAILEVVNGGTLLIDGIENLSLKMQEKLLHTIQSNTLEDDKAIDIRFMGSTSTDLEELSARGLFNKTLLLRMSTVRLIIPPLSSRKQDIQPLAHYFCRSLSSDFASRECTLSDNAYSVMASYDWPGNTRQLRNTIEKLIILTQRCSVTEINSKMLSDELFGDRQPAQTDLKTMVMSKDYREAKDLFERYYLKKQLDRFDNNITKTADFIGMDRAALHRKLKILGISNTSNIPKGGAEGSDYIEE